MFFMHRVAFRIYIILTYQKKKKKIGIAIPNFFITKQLKDLGKIPFLELKIK